MGIRVHKFLGYGLTDVVTEDGRLTDPRINPASCLLDYDAPSTKQYLGWLQKQQGTPGHLYHMDTGYLNAMEPDDNGRPTRPGFSERVRGLQDCFCFHGGEYGLPAVLAISPLACTCWSRSDDTIDYVEETWLRPDGQEPQGDHVDVLPGGIFPFTGSYMDKRSGERLNDRATWWVRLCNTGREEDSEKTLESALGLLAQEMGFTSHAEALENVVPLVPEEVRDIAEFTGLFTDETVWRQLRPLCYVYWA